jgi:hypothetical protein
MRRSGRHQICQPAAMSGEVAAARAAQKNGYARRGDPATTGSVGKPKTPLADAVYEDDDHQWTQAEEMAERLRPRASENFRD